MRDELERVGPHRWRLALIGSLEWEMSARLVRQLDSLQLGTDEETVIVDAGSLFRHLRERQGAASAIVEALKRLQNRGGSVRFVCKDSQLRAIFGITGFDKLFPLYTDEESVPE